MKELTRYAAIIGMCWFTTAIAVRAQDSTEARSQAIDKAREESIRRQELVIRAEKMAKDADQLARQKKYADAAAAYEQILKFLPKSPATEKLYATVTHGAVENRLRVADSEMHEKNWSGAREDANKVLAYDPSNREAKDLVAKADKLSAKPAETPSETGVGRPDRAPDVVAKEAQEKRLIREGRVWFESGHYDEAELRFRQALAINEYNTEAMRMLKKVSDERQRIDNVQRAQTQSERYREVTERWNPPIRRDITLPVKDQSESSVAMREKVSTEQKLNKIVLPEVKFDGARIDSVVSFLVEESRRLDPEKKGINIVLKLSEGAAARPTEAAPAAPPTAAPTELPPIPGAGGEGAPGVPAPAAPTPAPSVPTAASSGYPPITLNLRDIPLYDVLKLVTDLAGLKFRIERRSVVIVPQSAVEEGLISRVYPIQPGVFKTLIEIPEGAGGGGGTGQLSQLGAGVKKVEREDVRKFFKDAGVPFPAGASITYNDRLSLLIVSNTPENLELFERVIAQLNVIPSQVEIEAKFVEVTMQNVNELGFNWNLGQISFGGNKNNSVIAQGGNQPFPPTDTTPGNVTAGLRDVTSVLSANALDALLGSAQVLTPGATSIFTVSGVLTDPQFQVILRALAQTKNADLLSAPKVTTVSGNTAQIKIVREFRYPTEFTPPTATAAAGGTTGGGAAVAITPATPGGFETREVGVLLNVTPTVGPDGYTINLTLVPEVSDFDGFVNYGSPGSIAAGNTVVPVNFVENQPVFSSRQVTTTIQIWDGQTVVIGGLIREDIVKVDDKVPFLGDIPLLGKLFREKAESRAKRNLLIFVTAKLVDPAGNPIHKAELMAPTPAAPTAPGAPSTGG